VRFGNPDHGRAGSGEVVFLCIASARRERPLLPHIARQTRHDVVGSATGCRIEEHLAQRPTEASSGSVTPNHPEVGPIGYADLDITLSDGEGPGRTLTEPPFGAALGLRPLTR